MTQGRPLAEWTEEDGPVLWWKFPIDEAPYVGTPFDRGHTVELHTWDTADGPRVAFRTAIGGWPGYHTHWTPIPPAPSAEMPAETALSEIAQRTKP